MKGADLEAQDRQGRTVLLALAKPHYGGSKERRLIQFLLERGASATVRTNEGNTALHCNFVLESPSLVKDMLGRGADPYAVNDEGVSVLKAACTVGILETVQLLLQIEEELESDAGNKMVSDVRAEHDPVRSKSERLLAMNAADAEGNTALHSTVAFGYGRSSIDANEAESSRSIRAKGLTTSTTPQRTNTRKSCLFF